MSNAGEESVERLTRQGAPAHVADCHAQHQRHTSACLLEGPFCRINAGFAVERVEDGLKEQHVHTAFKQCAHLLGVGVGQLVEGQVAGSWIVHVGTDGAAFVCRSDGACHKTWLRRLFLRVFVSESAGNTAAGGDDVAAVSFHMVVRHRYPLAGERVGLDDVGSGFKIAAVNLSHHIRASDIQHVVIAFHQSRYGSELFSTEILFLQPVRLEHRAHRTVKYQYPLFDYVFYPRHYVSL